MLSDELHSTKERRFEEKNVKQSKQKNNKKFFFNSPLFQFLNWFVSIAVKGDSWEEAITGDEQREG